MEFWGVEVKAGQPLKVDPELGTLLHVSQASLGESKKGSESAVLYVKVGNEKFVIGNLSHDKFPQLSFDLVFEKEFELSHNWKNGSVYFIGYRSALPDDEDLSDEMDSDEEEPSLAPFGIQNGKPEKKGEQAPAKAKSTKPEASKGDEDEDSDEDDVSDDESGSDEELGDGESDDESDEEEEETPKKVETGKKRPVESATKTPASKKAKANTPQKTDGKKGGHVATPHPAKQAVKTPGNKPQTPKSGGQFSCNTCKKSFSSDMGLQSHNKAKHSAAK